MITTQKAQTMRKVRRVKTLVFFAFSYLALVAGTVFGQTTNPSTQPSTRPTVPFIIGVWQQPPESVDKWVKRGVNTFMGYTNNGGTMSKAQWEAAMDAKGVKYITYPGNNITAEAKQKGRVGWHQLDESDATNHVDKPGNTPAEHRVLYEKTRATGLPMYTTLAAFDNEWYDGYPKNKPDGSKYGHRASAGGWMDPVDVVGWDFYLWTNGRDGRFDVWERLMDRSYTWSDGKPQFCLIETCTQGKGKPYTADQFESEVRKFISYTKDHNYKPAGVVYFSHSIYPGWTNFDITSPEIADRMTMLNAEMVELFGKPGDPPTPPIPPTPPTTQPVTREEFLKLQADVTSIKSMLERGFIMVPPPTTRPSQP